MDGVVVAAVVWPAGTASHYVPGLEGVARGGQTTAEVAGMLCGEHEGALLAVVVGAALRGCGVQGAAPR